MARVTRRSVPRVIRGRGPYNDVKCSHGAAISDLEENQLFYFLTRGIDLETARKALIFSFGDEVIKRLPYSSIWKKVETHIIALLEPKRFLMMSSKCYIFSI